jgi:hypothetical protein
MSAAQRTGLSSSPTSEPLAVVRETIGAPYSELRAALEQRRERRLRAQAYNDMTSEALMSANYGLAFVEGRRSLEIELQKRVEAKKAQLGCTYPRHHTRTVPGTFMNSSILLRANAAPVGWCRHALFRLGNGSLER